MTYHDIVKHFGTVIRASKALNCSRQAIYRWKEDGVPIGTQCRIQIQTGGVLKADQAMSSEKVAA